jgi:hypothetical protein
MDDKNLFLGMFPSIVTHRFHLFYYSYSTMFPTVLFRLARQVEPLVSLRYPGFSVLVRVVSSCLLVFIDVCNSIILFLFSCNRQ